MPKLSNLPKKDLPREKLEVYGVAKLHDFELLALVLGSGIKGINVLELSKKVLKSVARVGVKHITLEQLKDVTGLGQAKASQVLAILELGRRLYDESNVEVLSPEDVWKLCVDIRDSKKEHLIVFLLDTQQRLIERQIISIGTLNASLVHPREVFEPAIRLTAASMVVAHNHPSGNLEPSREDREVTKRLVEAGVLLGIEVSDHLIVSKTGYCSLKEKNMIQ